MKLLSILFFHLCFILFKEIPGQTDEANSSDINTQQDPKIINNYELEEAFYDHIVLKNGIKRGWPELVEPHQNMNLTKWKNICKEMSGRCGNPAIRIACSYRAFIGGAGKLYINLNLKYCPGMKTDLLKCECWEETRKKKTMVRFYIAAYKDSQYFKIEKIGSLRITNIIPVNISKCAQ